MTPIIVVPSSNELDCAALGRQGSGLQGRYRNTGERGVDKKAMAAGAGQAHEDREARQQQQLPLGSEHDFRKPQGTDRLSA